MTQRKSAKQLAAGIIILLIFSLWLLFVTHYRNNATVYLSFVPQFLYKIPGTNVPYLISAGLPMAVFFLLCVLPDALGRIFPSCRIWNRWYIAVVTVLLTVQILCMAACTNFYVRTGIMDLLFGLRHHSATLRTITGFYVNSGFVCLGLSVPVWLTGMMASLLRQKRKDLTWGCIHAVESTLYCIVIACAHLVVSAMILNLLSAAGYGQAALYTINFNKSIPYEHKTAWIMIISAPIVEEIIFRGIICRGLKKHFPFWIALVLSAVLFGLWHRNLGQVAYTLISGILYGYIFLRSGTILWSMLIHFVNNLLSILVFSTSDYCIFGHWPTLYNMQRELLSLSASASIVRLVILVTVIVVLCAHFGRRKQEPACIN